MEFTALIALLFLFSTMCYQVLELYSSCRCLYYQHAVDRCLHASRPGHQITRRTILVGYACPEHSGAGG